MKVLEVILREHLDLSPEEALMDWVLPLHRSLELRRLWLCLSYLQPSSFSAWEGLWASSYSALRFLSLFCWE